MFPVKTIVQINPETKLKSFAACLMIVSNVDDDNNVNGCIIMPDKKGSKALWVKVPLDDVDTVNADALWVPNEMDIEN